MGHIGLTPQSATSFGGLNAGRNAGKSKEALSKTPRLSRTPGLFPLCSSACSCVAKALHEEVRIPILGIGAGPDVDCQILLTHDLLGMYGVFTPKFVKRYAQIREAMVGGLNQFHEETLSGAFPTPEYSFNKQVEIPPAE
jgi:3-methyl-2-oxobutanoate hydroxymethyltransferase